MEKVSLGVVGLGGRGYGLLPFIAKMEDVEIVAVCDEYQDRVDKAIEFLKEQRPEVVVDGSLDYMDTINNPRVDAVAILCSWEMHVPIAVAAMKAHKPVGLEVGGAYSIEDCWRLVRTQEETKTPFMLLENCCYGREEMLVLNLVRKGLFGELVHCSGGYCHDLRVEISGGEENRHYRLRNYIGRNCDNYPTHELGPIAKILDINYGNRMTSLVSVSSKAAGLNEYNKTLHGPDHKLANTKFAQGDIITTVIKCARGETITLTLDTCLPRPYYSRGFTVRGTKGMFTEDTKSLVLEPECKQSDFPERRVKDNLEPFFEKYNSPLWEEYDKSGMQVSHGGMDWHVLRAFVEFVRDGQESPIDVYDAASWMCISALSEASIASGSAWVSIPDFTGGKWIKTTPKKNWKYSL